LISLNCEKTPYTSNTVARWFSRDIERKNIPEATGSPKVLFGEGNPYRISNIGGMIDMGM
jgi:hypothetical protein